MSVATTIKRSFSSNDELMNVSDHTYIPSGSVAFIVIACPEWTAPPLLT